MTKKILYFIGLGLYDDTDMSIKAQEILADVDVVFAEFYTSMLPGLDIPSLEQRIGKKITVLPRESTEQGDRILDAATQQKVAFITGGDSMTATTHVDLRIRAIQQGIHTEIIHGTSILTAVPTLLGLQHYKFGRTTTLAYPEEGYFPMSPYEVIESNKKIGLHTLVLLDIQADKKRYMTATEGLKLLMEMEQHKQQGNISKEDIACVVARAGSKEPTIRADNIAQLLTESYGLPLHSIVIPGRLHFMELDALRVLAGLPASVEKKFQKL